MGLKTSWLLALTTAYFGLGSVVSFQSKIPHCPLCTCSHHSNLRSRSLWTKYNSPTVHCWCSNQLRASLEKSLRNAREWKQQRLRRNCCSLKCSSTWQQYLLTGNYLLQPLFVGGKVSLNLLSFCFLAFHFLAQPVWAFQLFSTPGADSHSLFWLYHFGVSSGKFLDLNPVSPKTLPVFSRLVGQL